MEVGTRTDTNVTMEQIVAIALRARWAEYVATARAERILDAYVKLDAECKARGKRGQNENNEEEVRELLSETERKTERIETPSSQVDNGELLIEIENLKRKNGELESELGRIKWRSKNQHQRKIGD